MANYIFESMTQSQAAAFTSNDTLFFLTGTASGVTVTHAAATSGGLTSTAESTTLMSGSTTRTFQADQLAGASAMHDLIFVSGSDVLAVGSDAVDTINLATGGYNTMDGSASRVYGFGGNDTLTGGNTNDTIDGGAGNDTITGFFGGTSSAATKADVLQGGVGNDIINGSVANEHIYGNVSAGASGTADGNDTLNGAGGNDYIQGNAGDDRIDGGADNDRLYGGAGNDNITGGLGNDYLQGNKGADLLNGEVGTDELHGGGDNDTLGGGADNDLLSGDLGDDLLVGGAGYDLMTGGAGADKFQFAVGDASTADVMSATGKNFTDAVYDFSKAAGDNLDITVAAVNAVLTDTTGTTVTNVDGALAVANGLFAGAANASDVVAIQVGADTYLFWSDAGSTTQVDEVLRVLNTTASNVHTDWFS